MELTVLVDNNTLIDRYMLGEPALSLYMEEAGQRVLFDCGYSDVALRNAGRLALDLADLDVVALSHGHHDHTWGLAPLVARLAESAADGDYRPLPQLVAHPEALARRRLGPGQPLGSLLDRDTLAQSFALTLSREPVPLTDRLLFLGEIPRLLPFEAAEPIGQRDGPDGPVPDDLPDDTALAFSSLKGLVIITGCSHAGICNIIAYARDLTGEPRVAAVIGGLHLLQPDPERFAATADYLRGVGVADLYPCHCTSLAAKLALSQAAPVHDVGSGLRLSFA
ncbi:MAG: MBL fold metallo-hydrolase [Acidobacteriota bacterium]